MERFAEFISKYPTQRDVIEQLYIQAIIDSYARVKTIPNIGKLSEPKIRNKLAYDLENKNGVIKDWINERIIQLTTEGQIIKKEDIYRTDIVFFISGFGSFVIECKRLTSAEQRYIGDGIRRFTDLEYAQKDEFAGMISFVVRGNILTIVEKLTRKVKAFNFDSAFENLLGSKYAGWDTSFQSNHIRINNERIHIYHLFFALYYNSSLMNRRDF